MATAELRVVPDPGPGLSYFDVISADGTRLHAWTNGVEGAGVPTVLLCNGLGTNPFCWPALLDPGCGVRVVSWNHRGVGGSERPVDPGHCGIDSFVEDAIALLDHLGIDACPVMGWSMGVNTMFELAYLHPERVTGLFAVGGVPGSTFSSMLAPLHLPRFARAPITVNAARLMELTGRQLSKVTQNLPVGPVTIELLSHSGFMLPVADRDDTMLAIREFLTTPIDWYMHLAVATSKHLRVSLSAIRVPTAFVAGRYDVLAASADMRTAAERIADATYVELKTSHFMSLEKPEVVHELLLDFLERVPS